MLKSLATALCFKRLLDCKQGSHNLSLLV